MSPRRRITNSSISLSLVSRPFSLEEKISSLISVRHRSLFSNSASSAGDCRPWAMTAARLPISSFSLSRSYQGQAGKGRGKLSAAFKSRCFERT